MSLCGLIESKNGNIAHLGKKRGKLHDYTFSKSNKKYLNLQDFIFKASAYIS